MFSNYLKVLLRNLRKHKGYSFINVAGLAIGMTCCIFILLHVHDELSHDKYNEKADRIYRVIREAGLDENAVAFAGCGAPTGRTLVKDYPEVLNAARFRVFPGLVVRYQDRQFTEERIFYADSTVFDIFTFPMIEGDPKTALDAPNKLVLAESSARKIFGNTEAIGKTLTIDGSGEYQITAIVEDVPSSSHFHFDMLASMSTLRDSNENNWLGISYYTYILLQEGYPAAELEAKLPATIRTYAGPQIHEIVGIPYDEYEATRGHYGLRLQPLLSIRLTSHLQMEIEANGNAAYVYIFSAIALFIIIIACINFMNLATARSAMRAKEIGVRKVLGSDRGQLIRQFLAESMMTTFVAAVIAVCLVALFLPAFNDLAGKQLAMRYFEDSFILPALFGIIVLVGLIAGSYPAFLLSGFQPVAVLKGKLGVRSGQAKHFRSGLVVFQFVTSIALIVGTLVVKDQLVYMQNQNLGFQKEHIVLVDKVGLLRDQVAAFKEELLQHPNITGVAVSSSVPGRDFGMGSYTPEGSPPDDRKHLWTLSVDDDFIETLKIEILAGRGFSRDFGTDSSAMVLNEAAAKFFGWENPVGKRFVQLGSNRLVTVIGMVRNFNFESLQHDVKPLIMLLGGGRFASIRIRPQAGDAVESSLSEILAFIEKKWQEFAPNQPFVYSFLDADFDNLYRSELATSKIFGVFTILAILIAALGLLGLAAFTAEQRSKEIGIRKVCGASVAGIFFLLARDTLKLVGLAFIITLPLARFAMNKWLQDFAYRIEIGLETFALAGSIALLTAILSISYRSLKAARSNPVETLRYE